ncbi:MAG TPA: DEAD/DEAH box helicase [Rhodobacteraceae bacterium]|nr:DEAD/DEAH box helicase [Paracoccaceae bacterium]
MTTFADLGLSPNILKAVDEAGYKTPSPIQEKAIPLALVGHDIMGLAQTGTGKTAAFGLPLIENLMSDGYKAPPKNTKALILAPTRELVNQIAENLRAYVRKTHLKVNLVVGGVSINRQIQNLSKGTDILVATPGRLIDLLDRRAIFLDKARFLVLDEADQMLDMGFIHALRKIAPLLGTPRQTMLFSATMPKLMAELAGAYLKDPKKVQVSTPGKAADKITQSLYYTAQANKTELLKEYLNKSPDGLSLVFSRTKHGAEKLKRTLETAGYSAVSIHGNKSQGQRERAIKAFKSGEARVLVATDVAARGIDIPDVSHVYNYDLPEVPENYVHRIGRTARAGKGGEAIAFVSATEIGYLKQIEKLMKAEIPCDGGIRPQEEKPAPRGGGGGRRGGGGGGGGRRHGGGGKPQGGGNPAGQSQGKRKPRNRSRGRKPAA